MRAYRRNGLSISAIALLLVPVSLPAQDDVSVGVARVFQIEGAVDICGDRIAAETGSQCRPAVEGERVHTADKVQSAIGTARLELDEGRASQENELVNWYVDLHRNTTIGAEPLTPAVEEPQTRWQLFKGWIRSLVEQPPAGEGEANRFNVRTPTVIADASGDGSGTSCQTAMAGNILIGVDEISKAATFAVDNGLFTCLMESGETRELGSGDQLAVTADGRTFALPLSAEAWGDLAAERARDFEEAPARSTGGEDEQAESGELPNDALYDVWLQDVYEAVGTIVGEYDSGFNLSGENQATWPREVYIVLKIEGSGYVRKGGPGIFRVSGANERPLLIGRNQDPRQAAERFYQQFLRGYQTCTVPLASSDLNSDNMSGYPHHWSAGPRVTIVDRGPYFGEPGRGYDYSQAVAALEEDIGGNTHSWTVSLIASEDTERQVYDQFCGY